MLSMSQTPAVASIRLDATDATCGLRLAKEPRSRNRGVVLTAAGLERLAFARCQREAAEHRGRPYGLEELERITGLASKTVARVFDATAPVDRRTLQRAFAAFAMVLTARDFRSGSRGAAAQAEPRHSRCEHQASTDAARVADWAAILRLHEDWVNAAARADLTAMAQCVSEDYAYLPAAGAVVYGPPALRANFAHVFARHGAPVVEATVEEVIVCGDWAIARSAERITFAPRDGARHVLAGRVMTCLRRESDGSWRFVRTITNSRQIAR